MADSGQEKTEEPTSKKLNDARKEGNVFQSKDIGTLAVLIAVFAVLRVTVSGMYTNLRQFLVSIISILGNEGNPISGELMTRFIRLAFTCCFPIMIVSMLAGIISHGAQTKFLWASKKLRPDFKRMNPLSNLKSKFSMKNFVEVFKNLAKVLVLFIMAYFVIRQDIIPISRMISMDPLNSAATLLKMIWDMILRIGMAFAVIAAVDFMFQRWQYHKDMMMTKQEVKDEFKQTEGNPEIKGRIRKVMREKAQQRMMQAVPKADVIVRNPTHVAVALKYDPNKNAAPYVLAKGLDHVALKIVEVAEENGIPWIENKPLARGLYKDVEIGKMIPADYYGAVAEILVYIFRQKNKLETLTR